MSGFYGAPGVERVFQKVEGGLVEITTEKELEQAAIALALEKDKE